MSESELKNPDGSWKYTNALAHETSPYLLQHAHNPVQWHAWGEEAFEKARALDRPIFLSVGYSTCYWCHVMERQVFENENLAALANEHFVCVKVDREERPDVDDLYMLAVQMMTQRGGWPMSVFLTPPGAASPQDPGLAPYWAGTYIPPEPQYGMPGFAQVAGSLSAAYRERKADVLEQAQRVTQAVREHLGRVEEPAQLTVDMVSACANQLLRSYEPEHGGFGGAPKFPQPSNLLLLMRVYQNNPHDEIWKALSYTLEQMARGGMYDQIGGGFHRYSTDEKWLVPHFEKMLYDNGQLVEAYLQAQQIQPDKNDEQLYERVVRQICDYVLREMTDASGALWSAQDAEVDGREGLNYLWTPEQVRAALPDAALAQLALTMYGLDRGTNFQDPHHPQEPPSNVLYLPQRLDELAKQQELTLDELLSRKQTIDSALLSARQKRKQPGTDDKVLASWNGMMIAALAMAGRVLGEPQYVDAARTAAEAILKHMRTGDGQLLRTMRGGQAKIPGFLEDYAFVVHGLLELHRATGEQAHLDQAAALTQTARTLFAASEHGGGYYDTLADQADLLVRVRSSHDGAIPSGNSQMVHNLLDLHELTGDEAHLKTAVTDLASFATLLRRQGSAMVHMQAALLRALESGGKAQDAQVSGQAEGKRQALSVTVEPQQLDLSTGSADFRVTLHMHPDYHINAHDAEAEGLVPTRLELENADGFALVVQYPQPIARRFPLADQPLRVYQGEVTFTATLSRTGAAASVSAQPRVVLRYQPCTDMNCLPPKTVALPLEIVNQP